MPSGSPIIFLLWGHYFDEVVAAIFVSELRQAGLCVKVLGLEGRPLVGMRGLVLTPDLSLGQLPRFLQRTFAIIVPCALEQLLHYAHDPRLVDFFQEAQHRQVHFVISHRLSTAAAGNRALAAVALALPISSCLAYPDLPYLVPFVHTLASHFQSGKPPPDSGQEPPDCNMSSTTLPVT